MNTTSSQTAPSLASVIIPTHNRRAQVLNGLRALASQDCGTQAFEVIVVADGCSDGTAAAIAAAGLCLNLRVLEQPARGPAAARNAGARAARSPLLIFMDDDILPQPGFVRAHLQSHAAGARQVTIGYLPPFLPEQRGYLRAELLLWWEAMFARLRTSGRRFRCTDLTSGNFSLPLELFLETGGFDPAFTCHEDYELGLRLLRQGASFVFSEEAAGYHVERSDLARVLERKRQEGLADVQLGRKHPELRPTLLMARLLRYARLPSRGLGWLAFHAPGPGDLAARLLQGVLAALDRAGMYRSWQRLLIGLMGYWYWRGAAQALGKGQPVQSFLSQGDPSGQETAWIDLDLAAGLAECERALDEQRPEAARLFLHGQPAGLLPPLPGGEALRGCHLRPALVRQLPAPLLQALAASPSFDFPGVRDSLLALSQAQPRLSPGEFWND